jgi:MFS family permease
MSFQWGKLADTYGRRPILLCGIAGTFFSITLFGFSLNYPWAIISRFVWGLLNGNIGVGAKLDTSRLLLKQNPIYRKFVMTRMLRKGFL